MKVNLKTLLRRALVFQIRQRSATNRRANLEGVQAEVIVERERQRFNTLLTPEELAERLKVPTSWVYEKRRPRCKNPLPAVPLGKIIRFDWEAIVSWLEKQVAEDAAHINRRRSIAPVRRIRKERASR